MSVREFIGALIIGALAGLGFATLFVHFMTEECIP